MSKAPHLGADSHKNVFLIPQIAIGNRLYSWLLAFYQEVKEF